LDHSLIALEIEMTNQVRVRVLYFVLILTGILSGCATEKCRSGGCTGDARITADVQARLNRDTSLGAPDSIVVQTLNGVVYLNGEVDVGLEKRTAESEAKQVPGVTQVVNNIAVQH
jgi:osmotically-inducible protein OsmY